MDRIVLSLLVDNTAGVLSRVAGLFSRRGYNIESLTVGVTADERYSRMTVVSTGDQEILEQIEKQLRKLEDVRDIKELKPGRSVYRELIMVKVKANASQRQAVSAIIPDGHAHRGSVQAGRADQSFRGLRDPGAGQDRSYGAVPRGGGRALSPVVF